MRSNVFHSRRVGPRLLAAALLLCGAASFAQQQVNLSAGPASATLPDGTVVPMWGYSCGAAVAGSTATCAALNPQATSWSPVVITVPSGQGLTINLTNKLTFAPAGGGTPNAVPTSLVVVGQLDANLGKGATVSASPDHSNAQANVTWPIAGAAANPGSPPAQGPRVQSFSTEVAAGATTAVTWKALRPGTYLIESGTHPSIQGPMGLYGMLVVTAPGATTASPSTAYPGVPYDADARLLFSEIDPVQNAAVSTAVNTVGFSETAVWSGQPGGCGNPASATFNTCYPPAVNYSPMYYLINGVAFDRTHAAASLFPTTPANLTPSTGRLLLRLVNAGLRMHVPTVVGSTTGASPIPGFALVAEDGNVLPGAPRVQNEVFMAAGKTYDLMINAPPAGATALPVYDRQLSLSGNAIARDSGMLAYVGANGAALPAVAAAATAIAKDDTYNALLPCAATPCPALTISDPGKGVIANDVNVFGVALLTPPANGTVALNANGTFSYVANAASTTALPDSFVYQANGAGGPTATVHLGAAPLEGGSGITLQNSSFTSHLATTLSVLSPGVLAGATDAAGYPLTVATSTVGGATPGLTVSVDKSGAFNATATAPGTYTFTFRAQNAQGTLSATAATVTLVFPAPSGLAVTLLDGKDKSTAIADYRWIIEEDRTFYIDPAKTTNNGGNAIVPTFGTNFHTSYMPVVAAGCTGPLSCESGQTLMGQPAVCDQGDGVCRTTAAQQTPVDPSQVALDPTKRYYISVLPGDAAIPFQTANASPGHGMGGAPITFGQTAVTIYSQPTPFPTAKLSVMVYEDDFPLNGEQDAGGGIDVLATHEPGLSGFNITLFDDAGGTGDATGQMTYDMFNQPLSNSLAGTIDPATGVDACPISKNARMGVGDPTQTGITGTIAVCPTLEADGVTLSPLAGQAVIANLMPGRYGVVATPGADRIGRGEEWLQTNTLDGQKAHDSFLRIGEPSFFQEFGPAGYHVAIGFANPKIINGRLAGVCNGTDPNVTGTNCTNTVKGLITTERMSRTPDERLFSSGSNDSFAFTQCYVSLGDTDGEDFAFTKCNADGSFTLSGLPDGNWRITVFDQWNDMLVDGLSTPVLLGGGKTTDLGQIAMNQWQANIYTRSFFDPDYTGVPAKDLSGTPCTAPNVPANCNVNYGNDISSGLTLVPTNIRFRDGSYSNFNNTDLSGNAGFNEVFPLFSWYVIESDSTRFKNTGTHVVYDAGGPADGSTCGGSTATVCGNSNIGHFMANTAEQVSLPTALRVPGAVYCDNADCNGFSVSTGPVVGGSSGPATNLSTGRIDPPWVLSEGWQGFSGQNSFLEFGKKPFAVGETGGIHGEVIYASTRPFDDPALLIHTSWTPDVPGVTINLYQEGTAPDGSTSLKLVDTTKTSSWDDWAQGFRTDGNPNMNCPGQSTSDLFYFTLYNQPNWLDVYGNGGTPAHTIPNNSQFKCYDGMHNWNQLQPAPYDGMYNFPSVATMNPATGKPATSNCHMRTTAEPWGCVPNPDATDPFRGGMPMLPAGKYVVEMIVPPGYELVKEEDKNILIGDNYIAPVTVEFPNLATAVYIMPDQAEVSALYNANNPQNPTQALGRTSLPSHEGDTGSVETFWPCVGQARVVPDFISLFPQSGEVAPFAGATRNLCDRKEVTLEDQTSALAKFWIFTSAHVAAHFTGVITDDFTSEFDPFSPQFGEKFSPPNMPVALKDWSGTEISRVYTDQWGTYNGLTYSTWEVNPPNPTGYAPTMMVVCMNDPGTAPVPDALYNPAYSQFCYEIPFMPGQTQYMDTPVVPTSAFAGAGYNNPDCSYDDATPAIAEVDGDGVGPWVAAPNSTTAAHTLTIKALGDQVVQNNGYSGPAATAAPFNQKTITKHYGFGATAGTVTIGGVNAPATSWSDGQIVVTVPAGVPACPLQQQAQYGGSNASCGELVVKAANGKQTIDSVTVTVGGKAPTRLAAGQTIQSALDAALPGDLIIVPAGTYQELLLMWKPVRLQGVGAASSVINANTQPAGKLDPWRAQVNCLFGLALNGQPLNEGSDIVFADGSPTIKHNPFDATGRRTCGSTNGVAWAGFHAGPNNPQIDRIPLEGIVGWDTTLNGNLAQLLQEPSLMGAYEGAGITVLAKGVRYPGPSVINPATHAGYPATNVFGTGSDTAANATIAVEGQFPVPTIELTNSAADCNTASGSAASRTGYTSNFQCNPARIDGLSVTDSSQGGGGIFVHGWAHHLEIANNRVYNNTGTLTGGIVIGQGESPDALLSGNEGEPIGWNGGTPSGFDAQPWTCLPGATGPGNVENASPPGTRPNQQLPYCYNTHVNVHHNAITRNSSIGDELFSGTPAGAGGVTFATGSDYYKFTSNFVCGNLSTGDGGGLSHLGYSWNGDIEHNTIEFNQSTNPTIATNGGGIIVMGAAPDGSPAGAPAGTECGSVTDVDCAPGLSDGTGNNLVINANLILGNGADSGSGGGLRLQAVNGTEVGFFPLLPAMWNSVTVTNNIIANNVAGWDGGGVSLQDALVVNLVNNTIMSNDTTASSGVLFNTLGAPLASAPGDPNQTTSATTSAPQAAGVVTMRNSSLLTGSLGTVLCPQGHATGPLLNGNCKTYSVPLLYNDVIAQNRSFYIGVGSLGAGTLNQQNVVALYNAFTTTPAISQPSAGAITANGGGAVVTGGTGACVAASYWDVGVRGDTGPTNHASGLTLAPVYSMLTSIAGVAGSNNSAANPQVVSQYCNGSRTPPEFMSMGYQVPPGISDATVPNPVFNLTPAATVDEGNNWINMSWGPLSTTNPVTRATLGDYELAEGSPAINYIPLLSAAALLAPSTDFYGNPRPSAPGTAIDVGAVEYRGPLPPAPTLTSIAPATGFRGTSFTVTLTGTNLTGTNALNVAGLLNGITVSNVAVVNAGTVTATFTIGAAAPLNTGRNVTVTTPGGTSNAVVFTVVARPVPTLASVAPTTGLRGTSVPVTLTGTGLTGATALAVSGTGVSVSGLTVVSDTEVTATLTVTATATLGTRTLRVTTPGGNSNTVNFTVTGPTLAGVAPASGAHNTSVNVTLTGANLAGATGVTVAGGGVTVSAVTAVDPTTVTATFAIANGATRSARNVTVTTPIGTTNAVTFTVN